MRTGGRSYYYVLDVQGSVIELTDPSAHVAAAYTYEAYGVITASSGPMAGANPFTFAGGYYDYEVALHHFAPRYEDPYTGSFTQLDPTGQGYAYAGDDPVDLVDPSGLGSFWSPL